MTETIQLPPRRKLQLRILPALIALIVLLAGLGNPPVSRTQEARVLETARQMLHQPLQKWLIPELNDEARLQKPPLTYWYTAWSFSAFGVSDFAGRLPTALLAWVCLLMTYLVASMLFSPRVGLLSAAMLMGSYLFARHARLAETDLPATLFLTIAVLSIMRSLSDPNKSSADLHLFALSTALTLLAKGGPALFAILFLIAVAVSERRWDLLIRFFTSGAIATFAIVSIPWFAYVASEHGVQTFLRELRNTAEGGDHGSSVLEYVAVLAWGAAPWSLLLPIALYESARRWNTDWRLRTCLLWIACIAIPLIFNGNKQKHYLLPLFPAILVLTAWWIEAIARQVKLSCVVALALASAVPLAVTLVIPSISNDPSRAVASRLNEKYAGTDLRFFGENKSPVISYNMKKKIPWVASGEEAAQLRDVTLLVIGKQNRPVVVPPEPYKETERFDAGEQTYVLYRR